MLAAELLSATVLRGLYAVQRDRKRVATTCS